MGFPGWDMPSAVLLFSAVLSIALDQATKFFVLARFREGHVASLGWVMVRRALRPGQGGALAGRTALVTLWVVEIAILLALVELALSQQVVAQVALGAALGGATSNLSDRLCRGGVVDFIDVGFWPVFNLADVAIVTGALLAGVSLAGFSLV
jgi:signal peptidase II